MYKIGIAFGGYCPLHQGHLDVIMRAKKENDKCVVIVCGYDNDRGGEILPLEKRYRIISNFLKDENVYVCKINDTLLGLDESMSVNNWKIWLKEAYAQISDIPEIMKIYQYNSLELNWYVSEPSYQSHILNFGAFSDDDKVNCIVLDRNENHVSGTLCRTQPLKYWGKITNPFKAYYSHNILVTGTASEGKTTLVKDIGKYFGLPYSYEKGRDICKLKTEPEFNVKDYIYNLYEQHKLNEEMICSPQNPGVFISDTDNFVTLMYAHGHAGKKGFALTKDEYSTLYAVAEAYAKTTKWNKIFLLKPSKKDIVDDGERYMPDSSYYIRLEYYNFLKSLYDEFGYTYEELDGSYYDNFITVKNYINRLYDERK